MNSKNDALQTKTGDPPQIQISSETAHDLRTPLNTILGLSQVLILNEPEKARLVQLKAIQEAGEKLLAMINAIAPARRSSSGPVNTDSDPADRAVIAGDKSTNSKAEPISQKQIEELPSGLRKQMLNAILTGDFSLLRDLNRQLPPSFGNTAKMLEILIEKYDQKQLLNLFSEPEE